MKNNTQPKSYSKTKLANVSLKRIPKKYRNDVLKLYSILSTLAEYAKDGQPGVENFKNFVRKWQYIKKENSFGYYVRSDDSLNEMILSDLAYLVYRYQLPTKEIDNYIRSIAIDMRKKNLNSSQDLLRYLQYSGEAPTLLLAKVLELPNAISHHAKMHGRSTRLLYLIRSINSNNNAGRCYFPTQDLKKFGLSSLGIDSTTSNQQAYEQFIALQIKRYWAWQDEAKKGDTFLPRRMRTLVRKVSFHNNLLADTIAQKPISVLNDNIKIAKRDIFHSYIKSMVRR